MFPAYCPLRKGAPFSAVLMTKWLVRKARGGERLVKPCAVLKLGAGAVVLGGGSRSRTHTGRSPAYA